MAGETLDHPLTERFTAALTLACLLHRTQARKGTQIPYVSHLLAVAALALEYGADEDEAIAAVLHDAVEDQGGRSTLDFINWCFGDRVAAIVQQCSDADVLPKPPWKGRKELYLAHLEDVGPSTLLVSACDKLHNARAILADLRTVGDAIWGRFNGGRDGTLWYYRSLIKVFRRRSPGPRGKELVAELERVFKEVKRLTPG